MLNNDIVGNDRGGNGIVDGATIRVYSEGPEDSPSRALARFVQRWGAPLRAVAQGAADGAAAIASAAAATTPRTTSAGFAAVGFRESRENFTRQHDVRDTLDGISSAYLAQNARVNAAALAALALAPPPPVVTNERGQPTIIARALRLRRAPALDGVARRGRLSRVLARGLGAGLAARAARRQRHRVRAADRDIDDYVFGVAAVGPAGHESTVSAYIPPPPTY